MEESQQTARQPTSVEELDRRWFMRLEMRYEQMYAEADRFVAIGATLQRLVILLGALFAIIYGYLAVSMRATALSGCIGSLLCASFGYYLCALIKAHGHVMRAQIDAAVNSSTLIDNGQKAKIILGRS